MKRLIVIAALALISTGCGQPPAEVGTAPVAPAAAQDENLARGKPDGGGVERIVVQASGTGPAVQAAVNQAIRLAYEQVNGKSFDATSVNLDAALTASANERSLDVTASAYADLIVSKTKGAVKEFRLLSQKAVGSNVEVLIEASIEKYVRPESANRVRIAISPIRTRESTLDIGDARVRSADVVARISNDITGALTQTKRVTVLDREFSGEIQAELGRIDADNWQNEDYLRLGQQLATDYLVVGRLERFEYTKHSRSLRTSDKRVVSYSGGAALVTRVINVATGQVEIAETIKIELPATKPTTFGVAVNTDQIVGDLADQLASAAADAITTALFPVTVVAVDGDDVVLSQGGQTVDEGQSYEIVVRGKEIRDPQTGQVIGRMEKPCCIVQVVKVTREMSYGVITSKVIGDVAAVFAPGALEVRGPAAPAVQASVPPKVESQSPRPAKPANVNPVPAKSPVVAAPVTPAEDDMDW
jgi:hypothetical protein